MATRAPPQPAVPRLTVCRSWIVQPDPSDVAGMPNRPSTMPPECRRRNSQPLKNGWQPHKTRRSGGCAPPAKEGMWRKGHRSSAGLRSLSAAGMAQFRGNCDSVANPVRGIVASNGNLFYLRTAASAPRIHRLPCALPLPRPPKASKRPITLLRASALGLLRSNFAPLAWQNRPR